MTKEELAAKLTGREMGHEITREEEAAAKDAGLVVLFGYSDDNAEFRGAIHDEIGCYDGGTLYIHEGELFNCRCDCECEHAERAHDRAKEDGVQIEAVWCDSEDAPAWTYKTELPHATFDVMEDGAVFCRGIVFAVPS